MTKEELISFEAEVAERFQNREIHAPIHLSDGNEDQLIEIFTHIRREDWVFSNWRSHYHALLHGVPRDLVMAEILAGRSMMLHFPEYRFFTSAIVGGTLSIACGVAAGVKADARGERVHVFVGDMTASIGAFQDAVNYASGHDLPVTFVVEDNGKSTNTPTAETWGKRPPPQYGPNVRYYRYERTYPHVGSGKFVPF